MIEVVERDKTRKVIYGLLDPRNEETFYIGESMHASRRYFTHLGNAFENLNGEGRSGHTNQDKDSRIRDILMAGHWPVLLILGWTYRGETEREFIERALADGEPLTNKRPGVDRHREETKAKMKASHKKRSKAQSEKMKEIWRRPGHREKMVAKFKEARS